jgi:RNA polymerase sigma-70 factor (ECF subfamily)
LVNRSLSGDQDAFSHLIDRYQNAVYGLLVNRVGDFEEAEDLTQDTFIEAYVHLGTLREPGKLSGWLCGITRNLCNQHLERRQRASEVLEQLVPLEEETGSILVFRDGTEPPTPEDEYASQEMKEAIWKAIGDLPEKSREVLLLSYFNEMSCGEIATFLGIRAGHRSKPSPLWSRQAEG